MVASSTLVMAHSCSTTDDNFTSLPPRPVTEVDVFEVEGEVFAEAVELKPGRNVEHHRGTADRLSSYDAAAWIVSLHTNPCALLEDLDTGELHRVLLPLLQDATHNLDLARIEGCTQSGQRAFEDHRIVVEQKYPFEAFISGRRDPSVGAFPEASIRADLDPAASAEAPLPGEIRRWLFRDDKYGGSVLVENRLNGSAQPG